MSNINSVTDFESSSFELRIRSLVNNEFLSDVTFLVGPQKVKIYGHKIILALASPVFLKCFYGDLKMNSNEIEITDLTPTGFINMLKQIYGHQIDLSSDLAEFCSTYTAADKYLVHGFKKELFNSLEKILNVDNCLTIYDQMIKLKIEDEITDKLRMMIELNANRMFKSKSFCRIDQDTLISVLNLKRLNISELAILKGCYRWVLEVLKEKELPLTIENKQKIFEPIKGFIRFSDLTLEDLKECREIDSLLSYEDIGILFVHLIDNFKLIKIDCQTSRERFELFSVSSTKNAQASISSFALSEPWKILGFLNVSRKIFIFSIKTYLKTEVTGLEITIYDKKGKELDIKYEKSIFDALEPKWSFRFKQFVELDSSSNENYKVVFAFNIPQRPGKIYRFNGTENFNLKFTKDKTNVDFNLNFGGSSYHIIKAIEFYIPAYPQQ